MPRLDAPMPHAAAAALALVASTALASSARAQSRDPRAAQPERPTVATHAGTVAPGRLEIETGVEHDRRDGTALLAPIVLKLGLGARLQLNVATMAASLRPDAGPNESGIGDVGVGVKWRFIEGHPLLGNLALIPSIKVPTGSEDKGTGSGTTDGGLLLISSREARGTAIDVNVGVTRRSGDGSDAARTATVWTLSAGRTVSGRLGWVGELFGYPGTSGPAGTAPIVALLTGPTWTARASFVLDRGLITPLAGPQPHALYAGVTWNVGRAWR